MNDRKRFLKFYCGKLQCSTCIALDLVILASIAIWVLTRPVYRAEYLEILGAPLAIIIVRAVISLIRMKVSDSSKAKEEKHDRVGSLSLGETFLKAFVLSGLILTLLVFIFLWRELDLFAVVSDKFYLGLAPTFFLIFAVIMIGVLLVIFLRK